MKNPIVLSILGKSKIKPINSDIYSKLDNKTYSGNVIIKSVYQENGVNYAKSINGIFSMRVNNSKKHFGNPFSSIKSVLHKDKSLIPTNSTKESVEKFIDWVVNGTESMSELTNHSGGAIGSDTQWDVIGKEFDMVSNKHYYFEGYKTPNGNTEIPIILKKEADSKLISANKTLGRKFPTSKEYVNNLLRRNWWQVKNSDSIFAISTITNNKVDGGTGWAVHMAISENKPVYVFDQNKNEWFTWVNNKFTKTFTPLLTKNFAGIGTRNINEKGKQAIKEVYKKTKDLQYRLGWIRKHLKSGILKERPIVYYKELGEPSHANGLDYLINKYNWNN